MSFFLFWCAFVFMFTGVCFDILVFDCWFFLCRVIGVLVDGVCFKHGLCFSMIVGVFSCRPLSLIGGFFCCLTLVVLLQFIYFALEYARVCVSFIKEKSGKSPESTVTSKIYMPGLTNTTIHTRHYS